MKLIKLDKRCADAAIAASISLSELTDYIAQGDIGLAHLMNIKYNLEEVVKQIEKAITGRSYG